MLEIQNALIVGEVVVLALFAFVGLLAFIEAWAEPRRDNGPRQETNVAAHPQS
jgi:hypothetical protein